MPDLPTGASLRAPTAASPDLADAVKPSTATGSGFKEPSAVGPSAWAATGGGDGFARLFDQLLEPSIFTPWAQQLLQRVVLQPGQRVLDVACGTGAVARQAAALLHGTGRVVGVDLTPAMLSVARRHPGASGIEWITADALAIPLPDASFDVIACQHGLQFFSDPVAGLAEMARLVRPGGQLVLATWGHPARNPWFQAQLGAFRDECWMPQTQLLLGACRLGEAEDVATLARRAGLHPRTCELASGPLHLPSVSRILELMVNAPPLAPLWAQATEEQRNRVVASLHADLSSYVRGDGLQVPSTAVLLTATV